MKKIFMLFILLMIMFTCNSCKKNSDEYIDLSNNFDSKITSIYRRYNLGYSSLILIEKDKINAEDYLEYKNKYVHVDFVNLILIEDDYSKVFAVEFESNEKANKAYVYFGNLYFQHNNCLFLDINIAYEFIYKVENNDYMNNIQIRLNESYPYIKIDKNINKISGQSGKYSTKLTRIILGYSVYEIAPYAFIECHDLKEANICSNRIGEYAFYGCPLEKVLLVNEVSYIGENAFTSGNIFICKYYKPENWPDNFVSGNAKVYWITEFKVDENNGPYPIVSK